jgi:hypothetical protein
MFVILSAAKNPRISSLLLPLPLFVLRRCRCLFFAVILERSEGSLYLLLPLPLPVLKSVSSV